MINVSNRMSKTLGLPPGTVVHVGDQNPQKPKITIIDFDEREYGEHVLDEIEDSIAFLYKKTSTWINIDGIHDTSIIERAGITFGLHPLVLEDIGNTTQRPKFEDYEDYLFIVVKMLYCSKEDEDLWSEQVSFILMKNCLITFQETEGDVFDLIRERLRTGKGRVRKLGTDYLAYSLMDAITDNYFVILEKLGDQVEELEEAMLGSLKQNAAAEIHDLKRDIVYLRRTVWPLRELISAMMRSESKLISKPTKIYLRDLYDHTVQVIDNIEAERDIICGMLDIYLSTLSHRMNEIVKVLTIISTIFIPLTFIAGVYGMNFENMPELKWKYGYFACLGLMGVLALGMLYLFKRRKWF